jgi:hypothetical protein
MLSSLREPPQKVTPLISMKSGVPRFTSVTYLQQLALPIACTHTARSAVMFESETHSITSSMFSCFTSVIRNTCNRNKRVKSSKKNKIAAAAKLRRREITHCLPCAGPSPSEHQCTTKNVPKSL